MNTVCKEADRDRSSIKTSDEFAELRSLISVQAALKNQRDSASRVSRTEHEKLKTQIDCLRERLSKADEALNDAVETIYDLNVALVNVEEDYRQLMQLLTTIRSTNPTVDKALRLGGLESQSS
jgi:uncharacterized coiled-coil DUF342 family protein